MDAGSEEVKATDWAAVSDERDHVDSLCHPSRLFCLFHRNVNKNIEK